MTVRVRYAPSPTGLQHVGGARTALFNYLFAKHNNGKFILRIEDTDQKRYNPYAVLELLNAFNWLGIEWDEGPSEQELLKLNVPNHAAKKFGKKSKIPYVQSNRLELYKEAALRLVDEGNAYYVFAEELDENDSNMKFSKASATMRLDAWRNASKFMVKKAMKTGKPYHIRLKLPRDGFVEINDGLRGSILFWWSRQKDPVILKTDAFPTYHLAMAVDDHLMEISHVIRGEEWISSLPRHWFLYKALGWNPPKFYHTASILNPSGKGKMSKRRAVAKDGSTPVPTYVSDYKKLGYVKEALINFMALTGWNPGDTNREMFTIDELVDIFDLNRLNTTPASWNYDKLRKMNHSWIKILPNREIIKRISEYDNCKQ